MIATDDWRPVLDGILAESDSWEWGRTVDPLRIGFFGKRLAYSNKAIQNLALAELSRAPYAAIRSHADAVPTVELLGRLTSINDIPYAPVAILLLGASTNPGVHDFVRRRFVEALRYGGTRLSAWAVAGVEVDRGLAVRRIADRLRQEIPRPEDRRSLIVALTVAGTALPELRQAISPVLQAEARTHPDYVGEIAYAFYDSKDWSLTGHFEDVLSGSEIDFRTRYILRMMVVSARARDSGE